MDSAPDACFVFFGAGDPSRLTRRGFRQNPDFHYLTGFDEAGAVLVLNAGKSHLFVQDRVESEEIWTGERYGLDRAKSVFGVDEVVRVLELDSKLDLQFSDAKEIYYTLGEDRARDERILKLIQNSSRHRGRGRLGLLPVHDPLRHLALLRSVKDPFEIASLKAAASATADAHLHLMKALRPGMTEGDAAREFQYHALKGGCTDLGYATIAASGFNATTLHYERNNEVLKEGDLLLVDAGGEVDGYTADLTQTFPVSSRFTSEQKSIYEAVLRVNREITSRARPGTSYRALHSFSVDLLTGELLALGVLSGNLKENVNTQTYRPYFPHGLGHYLGLDVHDAGIYQEEGRDFELKAGMVLTNEPGLYFRNPAEAFHGIGVRIEDDLLITDSGALVMTAGLPRDPEAIEALRSQANHGN